MSATAPYCVHGNTSPMNNKRVFVFSKLGSNQRTNASRVSNVNESQTYNHEQKENVNKSAAVSVFFITLLTNRLVINNSWIVPDHYKNF